MIETAMIDARGNLVGLTKSKVLAGLRWRGPLEVLLAQGLQLIVAFAGRVEDERRCDRFVVAFVQR